MLCDGRAFQEESSQTLELQCRVVTSNIQDSTLKLQQSPCIAFVPQTTEFPSHLHWNHTPKIVNHTFTQEFILGGLGVQFVKCEGA